MRRFLTILAFASPALNLAGETSDAPEPRKKIPAIALLPDGSELKGVMLPRYDENHLLVGVLKSKTMTLVNAGQIAGTTVSVEFFNPDHSPRGRIDLKKATFYQDKGLLTANEPVEIKSDRMTASGTGLYYSFVQGKGFLPGPATTTLKAPPATTMNSPHIPLRATTFLGMAMLTTSLVAAPPPLTPEEIATLKTDAISKAPAAAAAASATRATLDTDLTVADAASKAATSFLVQANLPPVTPAPNPAPTQPLDVTPGPEDTLINCTGGIYFDPDGGVLVYLKNVTVKDPRFNLSGADELKIFFGKKPPKEEKKDTPKTPEKTNDPFAGNIGANFGDVEKIVATGAVLIDQKATEPGKEPIKASGSIFTYNVKSDQVILKGGFPWVLQGKTFMRAKEPNLILRMSPKAGSFVTEGNWEMGGNLNEKR